MVSINRRSALRQGFISLCKPVPSVLPGDGDIDPRTTNPFRRLIELRYRKSGDALDDRLRSTGYKVIANSGAYGIFAQTTPENIDPDALRPERRVQAWGLRELETFVDRTERHGLGNFFPIASLVSSGARLLLALGMKLVHDAGGAVAYLDTDSLMVVSNKKGGFVPCEGGPYRLPDGSRAVRALSWTHVNKILDRLASLKVYGEEVPGSSFKVEDENFKERGRLRELWFYGTREKSYALYTLDANGAPEIVKHSAHTVGYYRSPLPEDKEERWIVEAWTNGIRETLGLPVEVPTWLDLPATSQLTLTTWNVMKPYANTPDVRPFDFLAVAQELFPGVLRRCCHAPRPSCPLFSGAEHWAEQPWRCLSCGATIQPFMADTDQPVFKNYRRIVGLLTNAVELKRLTASGEEPNLDNMRGLTVARPVRVASVTHVGKEIIVDPTDIAEGVSAEELSATAQVEYHDESAAIADLRERVKAFGIRKAARKAHMSLRTVHNFAHSKTHPQPSTLRRLHAALQPEH